MWIPSLICSYVFYYILLHLKNAEWVAKPVYSDQMPNSAATDLDLRFNLVCLPQILRVNTIYWTNTKGNYDMLNKY